MYNVCVCVCVCVYVYGMYISYMWHCTCFIHTYIYLYIYIALTKLNRWFCSALRSMKALLRGTLKAPFNRALKGALTKLNRSTD